MTRQNCKNCGEPYSFDNLVTPGRATMVCNACQRKIYVHTGQIYFEAPVSHISTNTAVKISLGQGVTIVQDPIAIRESKEAEAVVSPLPMKAWKSMEYSDADKKTEELSEEDVSMSASQWSIVIALYIFFAFWIILACIRMVEFFQQPVLGWNASETFVSCAFYAMLSVALAEGLKTLWRGR